MNKTISAAATKRARDLKTWSKPTIQDLDYGVDDVATGAGPFTDGLIGYTS